MVCMVVGGVRVSAGRGAYGDGARPSRALQLFPFHPNARFSGGRMGPPRGRPAANGEVRGAGSRRGSGSGGARRRDQG